MASFTSIENLSLQTQIFQQPSKMVDGAVFTVTKVTVKEFTKDGEKITVSKDSNTPKGFVVFETTFNQDLSLGGIYRSKTGKSGNDGYQTFHASGKFVDDVKDAIDALQQGATLQIVCNALQKFVGRQVTCRWTEFTALSKDGREYAAHICGYE